MPPAIEFYRTVKGLFTRNSQEDLADSSTRVDGDSIVQPSAHRLQSPSISEAVPLADSHKRERRHESAEQITRDTKRLRRTSSDERRLTGNFASGSDARKIGVPLQHDDTVLRRSTKMPHGSNQQGVRPMNTLNQTQPGRVAKPTASYQSGGERSTKPVSTPKFPNRRSVPTKVSHAEMAAKRQKNCKGQNAYSDSPISSSPTHPIDLTKDDSVISPRREVVGVAIPRTTSRDSQQSFTSATSPLCKNPFSSEEYRHTASFTEIRSNKKSSKGSSDEYKRTRGSSASSTLVPSSQDPDGYAQDAHEVQQSSSQDLVPSFALKPRIFSPSVGTTVIPTDSVRGAPSQAGPLRFKNRHKPHDPGSLKSRNNTRQSPPLQGNPSKVSKPNPSSNKQSTGNFYADQTGTEGANLSAQQAFHPVGEPSVRSRPKAKDRMLASSIVNQATRIHSRVSLGSEDELSGATTVSSDVPKQFATVTSAPGLAAYPSISDGTNPLDDLPLSGPSTPKRLSRAVSPVHHSKYFEQQENAALEPDTLRIPIRSLYCQSCVIDQDGAELAWDSQQQAFRVYRHGKAQKLPQGGRYFLIDRSVTTHDWVLCDETLRAYFRGSSTQSSTGRLLMHFDNRKQFALCLQQLLSALNDEPRIVYVRPERMRKIFERQRQELMQSFENAIDNASEMSTGHSSAMRPELQRSARRPSDDEEIIYESNSRSTSPLPRRRRLLDTPRAKEAKDTFRHDNQLKMSDSAFDQRRSTRQSQTVKQARPKTPPPERWTQVHNPTPWSHPVTYPATGARRVTVDFKDLERLDEGECLNDNLVDFAIRQIEESMVQQHRDDVHFFNSFFFSALSSRNGRRDFNYDAVKRWTRATDLFSIPYIVVPINVEYHWFIAIICNLPALQRKILGVEDDLEVVEIVPVASSSTDAPTREMNENSLEYNRQDETGASCDVAEILDNIPSSSSVARHSQIDDSARPAGLKSSAKVKRKPAGRRYSSNDTVIMTLDSLGFARGTEIRYLKQYVCAEALDKRAMAVEISQLSGITAKGVPEQSNYIDCGVYLIGYLEEFAKNPRKFVNKILDREMQEAEFESFQPSAKRAQIRDALLDLQQKQEAARKAQKKMKSEAKKQAGLQSQVEARNQGKQPTSEPAPVSVEIKQAAPADESPHVPTTSNSNDEPTHVDARVRTDSDPPPPDDLSLSAAATGSAEMSIENADTASQVLGGSRDDDTELAPPFESPTQPASQPLFIFGENANVAELASSHQDGVAKSEPDLADKIDSGQLDESTHSSENVEIILPIAQVSTPTHSPNDIEDVNITNQDEIPIVEIPDSQETHKPPQPEPRGARDWEF